MKVYNYNIKSEKEKSLEEQEYEKIKQDYEWLAKSNLEMIYKYKVGLSKEEIERLINRPDWKEKTEFEISEGWGTTIGTGSKGISYRHNRSGFSFTYKPIYIISLKKREIKMMRELTNQLALNQTIEEKTIEKWKKKFPNNEMEEFLTIKKELEELKIRAENAERDNEIHLEALETAGKERWTQKETWQKEVADKSELLRQERDITKKQGTKIAELEKLLEKERKENSEILEGTRALLKKAEMQSEKLEKSLHLITKPLPSLPKKQNQFQQIKTKIKTRLQQITKRVKKEKTQEQLMVAQIEVKN